MAPNTQSNDVHFFSLTGGEDRFQTVHRNELLGLEGRAQVIYYDVFTNPFITQTYVVITTGIMQYRMCMCSTCSRYSYHVQCTHTRARTQAHSHTHIKSRKVYIHTRTHTYKHKRIRVLMHERTHTYTHT